MFHADGIRRPGTRTRTGNIASFIGVLILLSMGVTVSSAAQSACRPADDTSAQMVQWVKNIATGTDGHSALLRSRTKIPAVSASQVVYQTSKTVCGKVLSPYNARTGMHITATGAPIQPSGQLYVVKAGTVYVAWDPVKSAGSFAVYVTLDSRYAVLWSGLN